MEKFIKPELLEFLCNDELGKMESPDYQDVSSETGSEPETGM